MLLEMEGSGGRIENSKTIYKESGAFSVHMGKNIDTYTPTYIHSYVYTKYLLNNKTDSKRQIFNFLLHCQTCRIFSTCNFMFVCIYMNMHTHIYTPVYNETRHKMTKAKTLEKKEN